MALLTYFQALMYIEENIVNKIQEEKMKLKIISIMLSGLLLSPISSNIYADAAEERSVITSSAENGASVYAVGLIARYTLSCSGGTKTVYINATVYGNDIMAKIGFKNIKIQRSSDQNNWTTEKTIPNQISEDATYKLLSEYSVSVNGGYYYRIVLDNYAKEDTWWFPDEQTVEAISNSVWIP